MYKFACDDDLFVQLEARRASRSGGGRVWIAVWLTWRCMALRDASIFGSCSVGDLC